MQTTNSAIFAWDSYVLIIGLLLLSICNCAGQNFPVSFTPIYSGEELSDGDEITISLKIGSATNPASFGVEGLELIYEPTEFGLLPNQQLEVSQYSNQGVQGWPFAATTCTTEAITDSNGEKLIFKIFPTEPIGGYEFSALIKGIIITIEDLPARLGSLNFNNDRTNPTDIFYPNGRSILIKNKHSDFFMLRLLNLEGKKVQSVSLPPNSRVYKMDINQLKQGIYIIEIYHSHQVERRKIWLR